MVVALWLPQPSWASPYSAEYDPVIQRAAETYWPLGPHWHWLKAQLIAESNLNPVARSTAGAEGIAQFMPRTWKQVAAELRITGHTSLEAEFAIPAAAYYMLELSIYWRPEINAAASQIERHKLALASYNAGLRNIATAQAICNGEWLWKDIMPCLPQVTGRHATETIGYVRRIVLLHATLKGDQ